MGCEDVKDLLALYAGGDVSDNERIAVEAHLAGCPACARELAEHREVRGLLGGLREGDAPRGSIEAVWTRVAAEVLPARPPRAAWMAWTLRAAAALVIGVALGHTVSALVGGGRVAAPEQPVAGYTQGVPALAAGSGSAAVPQASPRGVFELRFSNRPVGTDSRHHLPRVERILPAGETDF